MASETTYTESETTVNEADANERDGDGFSPPSSAFTGWFASSALRIGLVLVGVFLLLAALGQLSGIDMLGETAALLGTDAGRWIVVAIVALGLIAIALYGFTGRSD